MKRVLPLLLLLLACGKDAPPKADAGAAAGAATGADAGASADAGAAAGAGAVTARTLSGTYTLEPAKLYIPEHKDYASVKQAKSDDASLVGPGTLTLTVDGAGRITGTVVDGPAKGAAIDGTADGPRLRGTLRRSDLPDGGLTGVLELLEEKGAITGELRLATSDASVIRKGTVTLTAK